MNTTTHHTPGLSPPLHQDPLHDNVAPASSYQKGPSSEYTNSGAFSPGMQETQRPFTPGGHDLDAGHSNYRNRRRISNPTPLGWMAFGATWLLLSLINVRARQVYTINIVVALALAFGGFVQLLAGMWEGATGNTLAFTAFSSYGAFWLAIGIIYWPSSGIVASYAGTDDFADALGMFLMVFFVITLVFFLASMKRSVALLALFFFLDVTFLLLAIGEYRRSNNTTKAGGYFGILTALIAFYNGAAGLFTRETSGFLLPRGVLDRSSPDHRSHKTAQTTSADVANRADGVQPRRGMFGKKKPVV